MRNISVSRAAVNISGILVWKEGRCGGVWRSNRREGGREGAEKRRDPYLSGSCVGAINRKFIGT